MRCECIWDPREQIPPLPWKNPTTTRQAEKSVLACCALHNMLAKEVNSSAEQMNDSRDPSTHQPLPGKWKDDPILNQAAPPTGTNVTKRGKDQREYLTQYFSSDIGRVALQDEMI